MNRIFLSLKIQVIFYIHIIETGRKEGNVLFNDTLNTFYLRLYGVRHVVKDHSDSERRNPQLPHRLLFPMSSKGSFIHIIPQTQKHIPQPLLYLSCTYGNQIFLKSIFDAITSVESETVKNICVCSKLKFHWFVLCSCVTGLCRIRKCKKGFSIVENNICTCSKCPGYFVGSKCGMYVCYFLKAG